MDNRELVASLVQKARKALEEYEPYTQEQVDDCVKALCLAFKSQAELMARETVDETGLGDVADKIDKNLGSPDGIWHTLKGKKSVGVIGFDEKQKLAYVARPKGIMASVAPTTNPNITVLFNAAYALKGRNALIVAPHPRARKSTLHTVQIINEGLAKIGAPANLIQCIEEPSIECTQLLMRSSDVIIATGGAKMVDSAYSSGRPAFGVGPGNVQTIVDRGFDYAEAAAQIVIGRKFDNGLICAGNQSVIMPREDAPKIIELLKAKGAFYVEDKESIEKLRKALFPNGHAINPAAVGQPATKIAQLAEIEIPDGTSAILIRVDSCGASDPLCGEKMCPVLIATTYGDFAEAVDIARENLLYQGAGHSSVIHTNDMAKAEYCGTHLPVSRMLVNQPGIFAANPALANGLSPTSTLGCGSWGNNSISENLTYEHLINITRIAWPKAEAAIPDSTQIWKS
ncbi:MAG: aldehyde dehydrogenase family protein [Clostridiales bacterium]|jgi:succinate-semialdehyde dehydrogenase|nr:aldehyde dehydrogenase family protein [Clostridiales bacterium]